MASGERPSRPVLRWHGGKFRIRDWVISHFPPHEVYVEVFGGAASVLLAKEPVRIEVYNDVDDQVVGLFKVLRDPGKAEELRRSLELTLFARAEFNAAWELCEDPVESARRLIVRSFQAIGSKNHRVKNGWRTRTERTIWSPCSAWNSWPPIVPVVCARMRGTVIESLDWRKVLDVYDADGTLFYIDPPYPKGTRSPGFGSVYAQELTDDDHRELVERMLSLRGHVVASSYPNPIYQRLIDAGWEYHTKETRAQTNVTRLEALYVKPFGRGLFG